MQMVSKSWHFFGGYARRQDPAVGGAAKVLQPQLVFGLATAFDCLPTERWPPDAYLLAENHTREACSTPFVGADAIDDTRSLSSPAYDHADARPRSSGFPLRDGKTGFSPPALPRRSVSS